MLACPRVESGDWRARLVTTVVVRVRDVSVAAALRSGEKLPASPNFA